MMLNGLDATDLAILNLIQKNARLTHKEIAARTHKSLSAIQARVRKLEDSGVIKGYITQLDQRKIMRALTVFVTVRLSSYHKNALREFRDQVVPFEEVMECFQMSGDKDYILKVVCQDMDAYNKFLKDKLSEVPHMSSLQSMFVISEEKIETAFRL